MCQDQYSEFMEWVYKNYVKKTSIEKRKFNKIYSQLMNDNNLTEDEILKLDDREYFYQILHSRLFK